MWDVLYLPDTRNKDKKWYLLLHHYRFPLEYVKRHVQSLQKGSEADQYVVQNLTWSGVYLRSNLSSDLLQKILKLVPLTATVPEVYVAIVTTFPYYSYDYFVDTLNHMKSLKFKGSPRGDVADCYDAILIDVERLKSDGYFKPKHPGYIIRVFEDNYDSRFHIWATQKYKEVMEFVRKFFVCDEDVI